MKKKKGKKRIEKIYLIDEIIRIFILIDARLYPGHLSFNIGK